MKSRSKSTTSSSYFERPLAPAPLQVLVFVTLFVTVALSFVATTFKHDVAATFSCMVVLVLGAAALDVTGRSRAQKKPNPLYSPQKLPVEKTPLRTFLIVTTLVVVVVVATMTAKPGEFGSPLPYFLATGFIFLVVPQLLARNIVRKARSGNKS